MWAIRSHGKKMKLTPTQRESPPDHSEQNPVLQRIRRWSHTPAAVALRILSDGCWITRSQAQAQFHLPACSVTLAPPEPQQISIATPIARVTYFVPDASTRPPAGDTPHWRARFVRQSSAGSIGQDLICSVVGSKCTARRWPLAVRTTAMPALKSSATIRLPRCFNLILFNKIVVRIS